MAKKNLLSIYFTEQKLYLVECKGRDIINVFVEDLPLDLFEISEKEVTVAASIKKGLRQINAQVEDVLVGIPSYKCIVRFFELPLLSKKELKDAVMFEVEKYLPFPLENMVWNFHTRVLKKQKKTEVCFVGINKEIFNFYTLCIKNAELRPINMEPTIFPLWKFIQNIKEIKSLRSWGLISLNKEGGDILIIDNDFPCFYRDLKFPYGESKQRSLLRFVDEVRISFEYYARRYSLKASLPKIIYLCDEEFKESYKEIEKSLGVSLTSFSLKDIFGDKIFKLGLARAVSLNFSYHTSKFKINFLESNLGKKEILKLEEKLSKKPLTEEVAPIPTKVYIYLSVIFSLGLLSYVISKDFIQLQKEQKYLKKLKQQIPSEYVEKDVTSLKTQADEAERIRRFIKSMEENKVWFSEIFSEISEILPPGCWLEKLNIYYENFGTRRILRRLKFDIEGFVYKRKSEDMMRTVNLFLDSLRKSSIIKKYFKIVDLKEVSVSEIKDYKVVRFKIICYG